MVRALSHIPVARARRMTATTINGSAMIFAAGGNPYHIISTSSIKKVIMKSIKPTMLLETGMMSRGK
jgi:hypothetical protein